VEQPLLEIREDESLSNTFAEVGDNSFGGLTQGDLEDDDPEAFSDPAPEETKNAVRKQVKELQDARQENPGDEEEECKHEDLARYAIKPVEPESRASVAPPQASGT